MFLITDGKYYVMENPYKPGQYIRTTSVNAATRFTYPLVKKILGFKQYKKFESVPVKDDNENLVEIESSTEVNPNYKGRKDIYIGENDVNIDDTILTSIQNECLNIMNLQCFDLKQIREYKTLLVAVLSKYDCAESDLAHVLQDYRDAHDGKRPPGNKMAKFGYLLEEIREERNRVKKSIRILTIMENSYIYKYSFGQTKEELRKAINSEYQGRTEYYKKAQEIFN